MDEGYAPLAIPFTPIATPALEMRVEWKVDQLLAYLRSWSAAQRYGKATGGDAVALIARELRAAWAIGNACA